MYPEMTYDQKRDFMINELIAVRRAAYSDGYNAAVDKDYAESYKVAKGQQVMQEQLQESAKYRIIYLIDQLVDTKLDELTNNKSKEDK